MREEKGKRGGKGQEDIIWTPEKKNKSGTSTAPHSFVNISAIAKTFKTELLKTF